MTETIDLSILETLDYDDDGFMTDSGAWTHEVGMAIAAVLEIELTDAHWRVIDFARAEFAEKGDAPTLRRISKQANVTTKELYSLFPGGPAKIAAKVAGLPKPTGCI